MQHTFAHASLTNESSAALTNFPTPAWTHALGQHVRQASALTYERGHASPQIVNVNMKPWSWLLINDAVQAGPLNIHNVITKNTVCLNHISALLA